MVAELEEIMAAAAEALSPNSSAAPQVLVLPGVERALDAGTGTGAFALALAPYVGEVVGIDPAPELLEEAGSWRRRSPTSHSSKATRRADLLARDFHLACAREHSTMSGGPSSSSPS